MKKLLTFVYCGFITFLIASAVYATKTFDGAVENAYEKGMAYPEEVSLLKEIGWSFDLVESRIPARVPAEIGFKITDRYGNPVTGANVQMEISRLTLPDSLPLHRAQEKEEGRYVAQVQLTNDGYWQVQTTILQEDKEIHYLFKIFAEEGSAI